MTLPKVKWGWTVAGGVATAVILFVLGSTFGFFQDHFAQAGDHEARIEENKKALAPIIDLVEELGKRAAAEDAALEQDAMRCRQGKITDQEICGAAGVEPL